jgi:membrane-bound lytic murein transglycosylase C
LAVAISLAIPGIASADLFDELDNETTPGSPGVQSAEEEMAEFERFKAERDAEYNAFKEQLLAEFEEYKRIVQEETDNYRGKLSRSWDDPALSTNKVWVDYSEDTLSRNSVDFENETITIEVPAEENTAESEEAIREALTELVTKNKAEAFAGDEVAQNVERRSKEKIEYLVTAEVQPTPILISYLTGLAEATIQEVNEIVDYMMENIQFSEVENEAGRAVRKVQVPLEAPAEIIAEAVRKSAEISKEIVSAPVAAIAASLPQKAQSLHPHINTYAAREKLEKSLVFAIIETESAFNPMAQSPIPAYGLMQIVPRSAGMDATKQLFGEERILSSSYLYNSEQNIEIGTTYLNILYYRYLAKVENPESRLYCVIAAYNTGAGNVAKAFTGNRKLSAALPLINQRSPAEVYEKLRTDLPYEETQKYIVKVTDRMKKYQAIGL